MSIKYGNKEDVLAKVNEGGVVIVNFYADWCGPCKMMGPVFEEISEKTPVIKINSDNEKNYALEKNVSSIPATFIFKDGKEVESLVGYVPLEVLQQKIEALN